jgi:hypothetical protein
VFYDIGNPVAPTGGRTTYPGISGHIGQGLAWRAKAHRGSEDREFRVHVHLDIANPETPMGVIAAVL